MHYCAVNAVSVRSYKAFIACVLFAVTTLACSTSRHLNEGGMYDWKHAKGSGVLYIRATYSPAYCGGADPGLEGMPRTHPWTGRMFIRTAKPDSTGRFAMNNPDSPVLDSIQMNNEGD